LSFPALLCVMFQHSCAPEDSTPLANGAEIGDGWVHYIQSDTGRSYFHHALSQHTQWNNPFQPPQEDGTVDTAMQDSTEEVLELRIAEEETDLDTAVTESTEVPVRPTAEEGINVDTDVPDSTEEPERCWQVVLEASQIEERGMTFDMAGAYPGAVKLYREAATILSKAADMCPSSHPDLPVIQRHVQEVDFRAAYLESLGVNPAEIPIQEHIHGAQLTMGPLAVQVSDNGTSRSLKLAGSAAVIGGATGLMLVGPHVAAVAAAGAAYSTTRKDTIGSVSRKVGEVGLGTTDKVFHLSSIAAATESVKENVRVVDETLRISEAARTVDEALHLSQKFDAATAKLWATCEQNQLADKTHAAVDKTAQVSKDAAIKTAVTLKEFNEKYNVTGKVGEGACTAASTGFDLGRRVSGWMSMARSSSSSSS